MRVCWLALHWFLGAAHALGSPLHPLRLSSRGGGGARGGKRCRVAACVLLVAPDGVPRPCEVPPQLMPPPCNIGCASMASRRRTAQQEQKASCLIPQAATVLTCALDQACTTLGCIVKAIVGLNLYLHPRHRQVHLLLAGGPES